jgi:DNA-binding MarR family transcriptional regulator
MHMQALHLQKLSGSLVRTTISAMSASTDLQATWRELMAAHARVSEALEHALQERHDLSLSEYEVLQRLAESDKGQRRMQELADEIHLSQSALSRLVGRLEDAGLANRAICDHDRRGIWACITPDGRMAQKKAAPTHRDVLAATLGEADQAARGSSDGGSGAP